MGRWGDQHDGSFLNPVLHGDFSAVRVDDDFYAISSMQYSPGMVILGSRDLIDRQIVGHVVRI
jgi:beta-xylosidase